MRESERTDAKIVEKERSRVQTREVNSVTCAQEQARVRKVKGRRSKADFAGLQRVSLCFL